MFRRALLPIPFAALCALAACGSHDSSPSTATTTPTSTVSAQDALATTTPIKHVVVIFDENESFDHYFGTYPTAANPAGETAFTAASGTPTPNNYSQTPALATSANLTVSNTNNQAATNFSGVALPAGSNKFPFRLDYSEAYTFSQSHDYKNEEEAYDNGLADQFPYATGNVSATTGVEFGTPGLVMGYYDGNTVTGLWNLAQGFAMSDNMYTDTYGPSTPGAIEVISGQTNGAVPANGAIQGDNVIADGAGGYTMNGDSDPTGDVCNTSTATGQALFGSSNKNIGDLLNSASITWGGFMGGFDTTATNSNGTTGCLRSSFSTVQAATRLDYIPHHAWFQYFATTQNLAHTRPTSTALIGATDPKDSTSTPVHHQYDVNDFFKAVEAGNFPSVSYLKAPYIQDAHPGNSDPIDEQAWIAKVVNFLQQQPDWKNTAIIITYDDSDGWYDHAYLSPTTSSFSSTADVLNGAATCTSPDAKPGVGVTGVTVNGRCGPGTRIPLLVISPYAKKNYIDSTFITQASVVRFIEDNWLGGARLGGGSHDAQTGSLMGMFDFTKTGGSTPAVYIDPSKGTVLSAPPSGSATPTS